MNVAQAERPQLPTVPSQEAVILTAGLSKTYRIGAGRSGRPSGGSPPQQEGSTRGAGAGRGGGATVAEHGSPHGLRALIDLDLRVNRGEIFGLLGPNGAGKTTTVGILTTRVIPTAGSALVGGIDVVAHPARAKAIIGVVPQTNTLDRSLDVSDNLYYHGRYFGLSRKKARSAATDALEQFRLGDRAHVPVMALSGGMAQRLMVARAILHKPEVLFLDEPTAGLDPQSRIALWELVEELHRGGQTVLLTTHYMEEADQLCDRLAIMDHGRVLALDRPRLLKQSLGSGTEVVITTTGDPESLARFLREELIDLGAGAPERPDDDRPPGSELEAAAGPPVKVTVTDGVIRCFVREPTGVLPAVVAVAERHGEAVTDLSITEPTLESVFISLTGKDLRD